MSKYSNGIKSRIYGLGQRFAHREDGGMIIFGLTIFMMMLIASGMAIDFMRHENMRTRLQSTLDRCLLAATDLDQTLDSKAVVEDCFAKSGLNNYNLDVTVESGVNFRRVTGTADSSVRTMFLKLVGIDEIDAPASGAAEENINNVELSLVLDISGSMSSNSKMANMKTAAKEFVSTMITGDTEQRVSLSIIPYTGHVNAGLGIFNQFDIDDATRHDYSYCIELDGTDFRETSLPLGATYDQVQHYEYSSSYYNYSTYTNNYNAYGIYIGDNPGPNRIQNPWCSDKLAEAIQPLNNNLTYLHNIIDAYEPRTATGIHYGMKWGVAMLDPAFRPVVSNLITTGAVNSAFQGRPKSYADDETEKVVVLMTDGMNVNQYRIADWAYDSGSDRAHWAKFTLWYYLAYYVGGSYHSNYYTELYRGQPISSDDNPTVAEIFDMELDEYLDLNLSSDEQLALTCQAARNRGIQVFTIGFEISENAYAKSVMRNCASSDSHFYPVEDVEIGDAFGAIAKTINELRLIK